MPLFLAYGSGLMAALSPCVAVMIPLLLYRYTKKEKRQYVNLALFTVAFMLAYVVFGYFLASILTSRLRDGARMGLGLLFAVLGVLSMLRRLNPLSVPIFKSSVLLGISFAIIVSMNPCTIPYLGLLISSSAHSLTALVLSLLLFAGGLVTPAIAFALVGQQFLHLVRKGSRKITTTLSSLTSPLLLASGVYLMYTVTGFHHYDMLVVVGMLCVSFLVMFRAFLSVHSVKELITPWPRVLLLLSLVILATATITHCRQHITRGFEDGFEDLDVFSPADEEAVCGAAAKCYVCRRCTSIFLSGATLGLLGAYLTRKIEDRAKNKTN